MEMLKRAAPRIVEPYVPHAPHPPQMAFLWFMGQEAFYGGAAGGGKALALDTPVPQPGGNWTTMNTLRPGDWVLDEHGQPTAVLAATEAMQNRDSYALQFEDGEVITCDSEHEWPVVICGEMVLLTARELAESDDGCWVVGTPDSPRTTLEAVRSVPTVPVKCIRVDNPRGLFQVGRGRISTHNSDALLMAALQWVDVPHYSALILRKSWADLSQPGAIMDRAYEWLQDTPAKPIHGGRTWLFPSGARLTFGYIQYPKDVGRYKSAEFQMVAFDELSEFDERTYQFMFSRIRRPAVPCDNCRKPVARGVEDAWEHRKQLDCNYAVPDKASLRQYPPSEDGITIFDVPLRMRSASNPGGPGHLWVRERFVDPATKVPKAIFVPARLEDNPSLDQESYEESLAHLGPIERARLRYGDWSVTDVGAMFQRHWFPVQYEAPSECRWVRYWDLAATNSKGADATAGALLGLHDGKWYLRDVRHARLSPQGVEQLIAQTAEMDKAAYGNVPIWMEQEGGASGVNTIDYYKRKVLVGYEFKGDRPSGSKAERARPMSSAAEAGNFILVQGPWNKAFLDEVEMFPIGPHDDIVDACSGAMTVMSKRRARILV